MSHVYSAGNPPFQGSSAEQAAYARDEVEEAYVGDSVPVDSYGGEGSQRRFEGQDSLGHLDIEDLNDPAYLFNVLEEALPKQVDAFSDLSPTEQQKRDQIEHSWDCIRRWLYAHQDPRERHAAFYVRGASEATPLHLICKLANPPVDIIAAVVEAARDIVSWPDSHGWLPLHHLCANGASPEVMQIVIDAFPEGKLQQDNQYRTPLHFFVTRSTENAATMKANAELLTDTGAAELPDRNGMLAAHYAAAYGTSPVVLNVLADVFPASLTAKEDNGRTLMHLAMVNAHRDASPNTIRFLLANPDAKATINARDKDGFLPIHLLALGLKGYRTQDPEKRINIIQSLVMYLAAEPYPSADFFTALQDLPEWLLDAAVVSKHVRRVLNEKIVRRFPTSILLLDGYLLIVLIVSFAIASKNHIDIRFDVTGTVNHTKGAVITVFVAAAYFLLREVIQIVSLLNLGIFRNWLKDMSNWLDIVVIVLVFYYATLMTNDDKPPLISDDGFRSGVAITQGLLWLATIIYLKKTLVDFAVFVAGVFSVVQRLSAFLLAVGVILLAFGQMFYFLYVDSDLCLPTTDPSAEGCAFPHCTFGTSLLKTYTMMMGNINTVARYSTYLPAQIVFCFYAFIVVILLSNVLIAIVTDSYEIIQNERAAIVFWTNRLDFVAEMDAILYAVQRGLCCFGAIKGAPSHYVTEVKEGVESSMNTYSAATSDSQEDAFREGWHQVMLLFDGTLEDDIDWLESWIYMFFRVFCILIVIPLWLTLGIVTAGWLWPPQVREYLFVQKEAVISRAELERQKLEQLKKIQDDIQSMKKEVMREMILDREEVLRVKSDVDKIQNEVLSDLQQVRELMSSLLGT